MLEFQAIAFVPRDDDSFQCTMHVFGKTAAGESVHLEVPYSVTIYVKDAAPDLVQRLAKSLGPAGKGLVRDQCRVVWRRDFVYFRNGRKEAFLQLVFSCLRSYRWAKSKLEGQQVYESNVDPTLKFLHGADLLPCGWVTVHDYSELEGDGIHVKAEVTALERSADQARTAPLVVCSYDIETFSESGDFPDALKEEDVLMQIGMSFKTLGETGQDVQLLLTLGECAPIPGVKVESFDDEVELIHRWFEVLREREVDITLAYNNFGFDDGYIFNRLDLLGGLQDCQFGKLAPMGEPRLVVKELASKMEFMEIPGVVQVDLLLVVRREHNLTSYKLNEVAKHFVGAQKIDLGPKEMFALWRRGSPEDIATVGRYCVQDTALPLQLVARLNTIPNLLEMANATCVPFDYLLQRGQQIKCFSQILRKIHERGMVCPDEINNEGAPEKYTGAVVIEPKRGIYYEPIAVLDFMSLYPSILRANGICPSVLIKPGDSTYADLSDVEYLRVDVGEGVVHTFAQSKQFPPVLPDLLADLAEFRAAAKRSMKTATGDLYAMYDAKQLAYKISSNRLVG